MPEEIDETKDSSSESDEEEMDELETSSDSDAGADKESTDDEEDSEISPRTQKRINTLLKQRKADRAKLTKAEQGLSWYQEQIGDPDEVIAYRKWKAEQDKADKEAKKKKESAVDTSPEKIKAIRDLVLTAVPELKDNFSEKQMREEALWDRAEREVIEIAKDNGLSDDPKFLRRFGYNVMLVVNDDEGLSKRFKSGDTSAIRDAYKVVEDEYHGKLKGDLVKKAKTLDTKRRASRLPTAPAGSTTVSHQPRKHKGKGLDAPGLADEAYALITQSE